MKYLNLRRYVESLRSAIRRKLGWMLIIDRVGQQR